MKCARNSFLGPSIIGFLVIGFLAPGWTAPAHAAKVLQLQGRAISTRDKGSVPLARGEESDSFRSVQLSQSSRVQIQTEDDAYIEALGPAVFDVHDEDFTLRYGEYLIVDGDGGEDLIVAGSELSPSDAVFYLRVPMSQEFAEVFLIRGSLKVSGQELEKETLYLLSQGQLQKNPVGKQNLYSRIDQFAYSRPYLREKAKDEELITYRKQLVIGQDIGIHKYRPESNVSVTTDHTLAFGFQGEFIYKRYLDFPTIPQRHHYLRAPALRLGTGVEFESAKSNISGTEATLRYSRLRAFVGLSWLGFSVDATGGYLLFNYRALKYTQPYGYGVRAQYEFDLLELTKSNLLFIAGYSYRINKMEDDVIGAYQRDMHAIHLALAFLF